MRCYAMPQQKQNLDPCSSKIAVSQENLGQCERTANSLQATSLYTQRQRTYDKGSRSLNRPIVGALLPIWESLLHLQGRFQSTQGMGRPLAQGMLQGLAFPPCFCTCHTWDLQLSRCSTVGSYATSGANFHHRSNELACEASFETRQSRSLLRLT
jgi:hypothetical protein